MNQTQENAGSGQELGGQVAHGKGTDQGLGKALFNLRGFYDVPAELWQCRRTTNILEEAFREKRRRTRPVKAPLLMRPVAIELCGVSARGSIKAGVVNPSTKFKQFNCYYPWLRGELPKGNLVCKKTGADFFHGE